MTSHDAKVDNGGRLHGDSAVLQAALCHKLALSEIMAGWSSVFGEIGFLAGRVQQRPAPARQPCVVVGVTETEWHHAITPVLCRTGGIDGRVKPLAVGLGTRQHQRNAAVNGTYMLRSISGGIELCDHKGDEGEWAELAIPRYSESGKGTGAVVTFRVAVFHDAPMKGMVWSVYRQSQSMRTHRCGHTVVDTVMIICTEH